LLLVVRQVCKRTTAFLRRRQLRKVLSSSGGGRRVWRVCSSRGSRDSVARSSIIGYRRERCKILSGFLFGTTELLELELELIVQLLLVLLVLLLQDLLVVQGSAGARSS
jgi:hypothetical protein